MDASPLAAGLRVSFPQAVGIGALAVLLYFAGVAIYRLYFSPLAKFPGPKLHAISYIPHLWKDKILGTWTHHSTALHAKYGPIVRIAPDHIAVDGSIGWPQVFMRRANEPEFGKSAWFYQNGPVGIFQADRDDHRRQRRVMAHAFSSAALQEQEDFIRFHLNTLIQRLREHADKGQAVDISRWYNFLTFDIIGDLAFGESFGCLADSNYHPFVALLFDSIKASSTNLFMNSFGLLRPFMGLFLSTETLKNRQETIELSLATMNKRIALGADARRDFMTYLLRNQGEPGKGMTDAELATNARSLIVAGSETTATALSGFSYYVTREPEVYKRLTDEIRSVFGAEKDIDIRTTDALPYLRAVIEETLRVYPPASSTPPRVSPGAEVDGHFIPKGTFITVYQWSTYRNPKNFADPERFVPERWLPSSHPLYNPKYESDNKAVFKPFAAGPRDCIGKNLAYAEMRLVVARLLWNFDMEAVPGQDDWISNQRVFIVAEKGDYQVKLKPVQRA